VPCSRLATLSRQKERAERKEREAKLKEAEKEQEIQHRLQVAL
jgi:hypothetical protein